MKTNPRFLIDTDILSFAIRGNQALNSKLLLHAESWAMSSVTAVELSRYSQVAKSERVRLLTKEFLEHAWILDFGKSEAEVAGHLLASIQLRQAKIGIADIMIAAQAINASIPLISNNEKDFERVPGLTLQNWLD